MGNFGWSFACGNVGLELHLKKKKKKGNCPFAEIVVKEEIKRSMLRDVSSAAAILRLAFHDCPVDVIFPLSLVE